MVNPVKYSILINTSDRYEDCWIPFFLLLSKYWRPLTKDVYLNTQKKEWTFDKLKINCIRSEYHSNCDLSWSESLIFALKKLSTPLVLYLQEDYFIEAPVKVELIERFASYMENDPNIKHIGLTPHRKGPFYSSDLQELWKIDAKSNYRLSTQAGLWRVETLLSYLRPEENGWMFEIFGSKRSQKRNELFLTINRDMYNNENGNIIKYNHSTGIIKWKWHRSTIDLFRKHQIVIDFDKRGFWDPKSKYFIKLQTIMRLLEYPQILIKVKFKKWRHIFVDYWISSKSFEGSD